MDQRIGKIVLQECLGCRPGENLLVVTDTHMEPAARRFHEAALGLGLDSSVISMPPRRTHAEEPTPAVAAALQTCSVAVLLTLKSLLHTEARREATEKKGVRVASMPGVDMARLPALLDVDYAELHDRCGRIAGLLKGAREVRVRSDAGTDLAFAVNGRPVHCDDGRIRESGQFGSLPAGQVCLAPVEGSARGTIVVDGSIATSGLLSAPVTVRFERGRAVEISDPDLRDLLNGYGPEASSLAEFGIGANPNAQITGNVIEDQNTLGSVHIALGTNRSLGGSVRVPVHIDLVLRDSRVEIDGSRVPEEILARPAAVRASVDSLASMVHEAETFRALFEHSNDAQYLLDAESQRILLVNAAFERMTGFSRDEIAAGEITAEHIVAGESRDIYNRRRTATRKVPSERFDLKLRCKSGEKKPVEFSVTRSALGGREVMIGSIHDLTMRKKLEVEMWDKIEELSRANNRIFALTEKIRRVPDFTPALLHITDESDLLNRAAQLLCARDGLAYAAVAFYLLRDDGLELTYSSSDPQKEKTKIPADHELLNILRGEKAPVLNLEKALLPLKGRERNLGVLQVSFHPKEIEVLKGNDRALKGYNDLLLALSNVLGLLIENLHLYAQVRRQATTDPLTGAYNRRFFDAKLTEEIHRARRYDRSLSLVMIDLDHFKEINDSFGHHQGDAVLAEVAQLLRAHTRDVDVVCRYGGDEFIVLMPETPYDGAASKAENLRKAIAHHRFHKVQQDDREMNLTLSIGVTSFSPDSDDNELLRSADDAMFRAKRSGRNRVVGTEAQTSSAPPPPSKQKKSKTKKRKKKH